jgi:hypothetical protein
VCSFFCLFLFVEFVLFFPRFFYCLEFVACFFSCFVIFFEFLRFVSEVFRFFARIATFRSSPLRSIPGFFNDTHS